MNPRAKEDLLCLVVLVAAIPLFPVQDSYCGQVYMCTTNKSCITVSLKSYFELGCISEGGKKKNLCEAAQ